MKNLSIIAILFISITSHAGHFIKSPSMYGLQKRTYKMVDLDSDYILYPSHRKHNKFVDIKKITKNITNAYINPDVARLTKLTSKRSPKNTRLVNFLLLHELFGEDEIPFYCQAFKNSLANHDEEKCKTHTTTLIGDAAANSDAAYILEIEGEDEYSFYAFTYLILLDYKTKESQSIQFGIVYEI